MPGGLFLPLFCAIFNPKLQRSAMMLLLKREGFSLDENS